MKTLLKVLLGAAVVVGAIVGVVFWATAGLPDAANKFLGQIAANDYDGALALTTTDFRASTDRAGLERFARANGIDGFQDASWSSRSIDNNIGTLEGTITVAAGAVIPLRMTLVKTDGKWLVQNLDKAAAGVSSGPTTPASPATAAPRSAPDGEAQQRLVADTLAAFAESINANDFSILHATGASPFREQLSPEKLQDAFAGFVEQDVDLSVLADMTPSIDAGSGLDDKGVLRLAGSYATEPSKASFALQYIEEDGAWRLIDINVQVR